MLEIHFISRSEDDKKMIIINILNISSLRGDRGGDRKLYYQNGYLNVIIGQIKLA